LHLISSNVCTRAAASAAALHLWRRLFCQFGSGLRSCLEVFSLFAGIAIGKPVPYIFYEQTFEITSASQFVLINPWCLFFLRKAEGQIALIPAPLSRSFGYNPSPLPSPLPKLPGEN
jgi:hypothetical protein